MGFHFPVSLHNLTKHERDRLDNHLISLKAETKNISNEFHNEPDKCTTDLIHRINILLRRYSAIVFGNIMDYKGSIVPIIKSSKRNSGTSTSDIMAELPTPVMNMLIDDLAPYVYSMKPMRLTSSYNRQYETYKSIKYSQLGEGFITLIGSYMTNLTIISYKGTLGKDSLNSIAMHGVIILNTLNSWIHQEIHLIPETVSYVHGKTNTSSRLEASRKANDVRYESLRKFKEKAAMVAKHIWENGSTLPHHKMAKYLIEEYEENGKRPFSLLPVKDDEGFFLPPDKVLRETVKDVAKGMNRPDLISGQKKSS